MFVTNDKKYGSAKQPMVNLDKVEKVLKGKAALGLKKFNDIRDKIRAEAIEMRLNDDSKQSKQLHGGWVLSDNQMNFLRNKPYIYNASAGSYLELLCLQRFWVWLAKFIPLSVSPCVLTCVGLIINIITSCAVLYYSPDARSEVPSWAFLLCAIGVFVYQTLDALDGKQSYKVQCTQIEEVYDHGCDAISTIFVTLAVACSAQLGRSPILLFALFLSAMLAFYSSHWLCHVTHQMVFGKIDVSEGQWVIIMVHLMSAVFGQRMWNYNIGALFSDFDLQISHILGLLTVLSFVKVIAINVSMICGKPTPLDNYVVIPRRSTNIWRPALPVTVLTSLALLSYATGYFHVSPALFVFTFGLAFAKLTLKLVMTNCSNGESEIWDTSLIAPFLLALNSRLLTLSLFHPKTALLCAFVYSLMDIARYFTYASWDLRAALDLSIFSIKYPVGHAGNRRECGGYYINGLNNEQLLPSSDKRRVNHESKHEFDEAL